MRQDRDDGLLNFLFGLFFGVLAGYVAGVLTAEKTGSELRRDIEMNSTDVLSNLRNKFEDVKDQTVVAMREFKGFTDDKLKASAKNIEDQVNSLGQQLEELTKKQAEAFSKN